MTPRPRRTAEELMDRPDADPGDLTQALRDLRLVNRWMGGRSVAVGAALDALRSLQAGGPVLRVLDVCTGSADIPVALARRAPRRGIKVHVLATDLHPRTVEDARQQATDHPSVEIGVADALDLPFERGAFDVAMCHTALHHFDDAGAVRLLEELRRVASGAVVVTDLYRSRISEPAVTALAATLWRRHRITRHDSIASIRAAFTPDEALELARAAGLSGARVRRHPFFRFSLVEVGRASGL